MRRLLLDLDSYGGIGPVRMYPLFPKRTAGVLAPGLAVIFRRLLCLGGCPVCWRVANGPPFSPVVNYRPIFFNTNTVLGI